MTNTYTQSNTHTFTYTKTYTQSMKKTKNTKKNHTWLKKNRYYNQSYYEENFSLLPRTKFLKFYTIYLWVFLVRSILLPNLIKFIVIVLIFCQIKKHALLFLILQYVSLLWHNKKNGYISFFYCSVVKSFFLYFIAFHCLLRFSISLYL